jgi:hypothetical protein
MAPYILFLDVPLRLETRNCVKYADRNMELRIENATEGPNIEAS